MNRFRKTRPPCALLMSVAMVLPPWGGRAAAAQRIPEAPSCPECRIGVDTVALFGHLQDGGMIGTTTARVFLLKDGRYATKDVTEPGVIRFYDSAGRYQDRIEREGRGPGEYIGINSIFATPEGYLIYDVSLGRLTWVDDEFNFLRTHTLGMQATEIAPLRSGDGLVAAGLRDDGVSGGHVVHVLSFEDGFGAVFGGTGQPMNLREDRSAHLRLVDVDANGSVWASRLNRYELVRYSLEGDTLERLDLERDFPGGGSRLSDLIVDQDGLLWVTAVLEDEDWEQSLEYARAFGTDWNGKYDTLVEVIDPRTARVVARMRSPHRLMPVYMAAASGQMLFNYNAEQANGFLGATVLRLSLDGYH